MSQTVRATDTIGNEECSGVLHIYYWLHDLVWAMEVTLLVNGLLKDLAR
jgi:hypothetical protein